MSRTNIPIGEPFYLAAADFNADDSTYDFAVDGHPGVFATEAEAVEAMSDDVLQVQSSGTIYHCVPVARVTPLPRVKVKRFGAARKAGDAQ